MDRRFLPVLLAILAPMSASADGPPSSTSPAAPIAICCAPAPLWTGFYLGINGGGAWSDPSWTFPIVESFGTAPGQGFSPAASGRILGGHLGFNYQLHNFLMGLEVSYADSKLFGDVRSPIGFLPGDRFIVEANDLFTATGRLGYIVRDQYLFYAKGGYASSLIEINAASATTGFAAHASSRENGWLAGAGLEARMVSNILFGLEYGYVNLPDERFAGITSGIAPGLPFHADVDLSHMHVVTARLSILFGPHACCSEGVLGKY